MVTEEARFHADDIFGFLGQTLTVRSNSQEVLDYLRSVYRHFYTPAGTQNLRLSDPERAPAVLEVVDRLAAAGELFVRDEFSSLTLSCNDLHSLKADGNPPADDSTYPLAYVEAFVLRNIAQRANGYHLVHSGSVAWRDTAVILPGVSGRGKTTLCLELLGQGFKLLSDELACVGRDSGIVEPFPRLMKIDEQSRQLLGIPTSKVTRGRYKDGEETPWLLDVEDVFPSGIGEPARLLYIVFLNGFAETTRLEPLSQVRALIALAKLSLWRPDDAPAALFEFAPFLEKVRCFSLVIGDLDEAAELIRALLDDEPDLTP